MRIRKGDTRSKSRAAFWTTARPAQSLSPWGVRAERACAPSSGIGALHCTANELLSIAQLGLANSSFKRQAGYSSVGRASDCRTLQRSDGPWFDSGWPDISAWCSPMQRTLFYYCKRIHVRLLPSGDGGTNPREAVCLPSPASQWHLWSSGYDVSLTR